MSERGKIALQCLEVGRNHRTCGGMDAAINKIENLQARLDGLLTEYRLVLDTRDKRIEELEAEREWQPIKTYDKLKVKPKFAVFFVQSIEPKRAYGYRLSEMTTSTRVYGNRAISHWMPLPAPPEEAENE